MANDVKILITAIDNASKSMGGVLGSFTELQSAFGLAERALGFLDKAFDATVGEFIKYSEQVEDMSRLTGMSAEQTSRLIQTADDLFVSYESLKTATRSLASQGIVPTIDKMAELSDRYLNFKDKSEQAEWASKKFGRQYAEITKILEAGSDAIREMAANQPEGLVLSEQDLADATKYKQSLDALNDTWTALKISAGKLILPVVVQGIDKANASITALEKHWKDYVYVRYKYGTLEFGWLEQFEQEDLLMSGGADHVNNVTRAYTEMARQIEENTSLTEEHAEVTDSAMTAMDAYNYATGRADQALQGLDGEIGRNNQLAQEAANSIGNDLAKAYDSLAAAQRAWQESVAEDAASSLKAMSEDAQLTAQGLGAIDSVFGTNTLAREQYATKLEEINAEFVKTGDVDAYKSALGELADTFEASLAKDIGVAQTAVDNLQHALDLLGKTPAIHIPVNIDVIYPNGPVPSAAGGGGPATGGSGSGGGSSGGGQSGGGRFQEGGGKGPGMTVNNFYPANGAAMAQAMNVVAAQIQTKRTNTRMSVPG